MTTNEYILPLPELNILLTKKYLDPLENYKYLRLTNKYYNEIIIKDRLYIELQELY